MLACQHACLCLFVLKLSYVQHLNILLVQNVTDSYILCPFLCQSSRASQLAIVVHEYRHSCSLSASSTAVMGVVILLKMKTEIVWFFLNSKTVLKNIFDSTRTHIYSTRKATSVSPQYVFCFLSQALLCF